MPYNFITPASVFPDLNLNCIALIADVVLKYPLLTNPKPEWDVDYISCERRDTRKQLKSLIKC